MFRTFRIEVLNKKSMPNDVASHRERTGAARYRRECALGRSVHQVVVQVDPEYFGRRRIAEDQRTRRGGSCWQ